MKITIRDIPILDERIVELFSKFVKDNIHEFDNEKTYKLSIVFNKNDLSIEDDTDDHLLDELLEKSRTVLANNNVECYYLRLMGDNINENIVEIVIDDDKSEHGYIGTGKNKKRLTVKTIAKDISYTREVVSKFCVEQLMRNEAKKYNKYESMCKRLNITYTEDENLIYDEYCRQIEKFE